MTHPTFEELKDKVEQWAKDRKIIPNATPLAQAIKTAEECVELLAACHSGDREEMKDAYGDIFVTILIGSSLAGFDLLDCLQSAYDTIKDRRGTLGVDGIFRKEVDNG